MGGADRDPTAVPKMRGWIHLGAFVASVIAGGALVGAALAVWIVVLGG